MDKNKAKEEIAKLRKQLEIWSNKYYDEDNPEVSDYEYDMTMNKLKELEKEFPDLITKDSLTQKVGGHVKEGFTKVTHEVPLQSLQDVFNFEELYEFDERIKQKAQENEIDEVNYVVETKIDGLSAALEYKNGKFVRGATRGNGFYSSWRSIYFKKYRLVAVEKGGKVIAASVWGKLKTVTQMLALILALVDINGFAQCFIGGLTGGAWWYNFITTILMSVSVIATIFSGVNYITNGKDLFKEEGKVNG